MRTNIGPLTHKAQRDGLIDMRYLNFWPTKCQQGFIGKGTADCPGMPPNAVASIAQTEAPAKLGASGGAGGSGIRVAVGVSGFLRTFAVARQLIFAHLVHPHDADFYGLTWNVLGRVKKGVPIPPKQIIGVAKMKTLIMGLLQQSAPKHFTSKDLGERYVVEVWEHKKMQRYHAFVKKQGYHHVGMYHQLAESVAMMLRSGKTYDIALRTRWDIFVATPYTFRRLVPFKGAASSSEGDRFVLDLGVHCQMDGIWYPRALIVEPGKVIRHTADTRYKLFSWQACDYMDVGPWDTVKKIGGLFDWIRRFNVNSGAQWVEHAFFIDQDIAYRPAHLFLCFYRHASKFFC